MLDGAVLQQRGALMHEMGAVAIEIKRRGGQVVEPLKFRFRQHVQGGGYRGSQGVIIIAADAAAAVAVVVVVCVCICVPLKDGRLIMGVDAFTEHPVPGLCGQPMGAEGVHNLDGAGRDHRLCLLLFYLRPNRRRRLLLLGIGFSLVIISGRRRHGRHGRRRGTNVLCLCLILLHALLRAVQRFTPPARRASQRGPVSLVPLGLYHMFNQRLLDPVSG
mmetsp:Transcript_47313/g.64411  ORF Transcript_47313/g.64411 Transcript_47313/m.64411 type:complete len:218 (+) Transcript_47313:437-1090(+)